MTDGKVRISIHKQHKSMDPFDLVSTFQAASGGAMVWDIFLAHLETRKTSAIFFTYFFSYIFIGENNYHLITIAYLSVIAEHVPPISQKDSTPCHTVQILSNQFFEHDNAFSVLTFLDKH